MAACKTIVSVVAGMVMMAVSGPALSPALADRHMPTLPITKVAGDGMYAQEWLYKTSFNLRQDLAATKRDGKRLVIFWEQKECPYCKPMYEINLRIPRIVEKIKKNFNVIKLNTWGGRKITALDGTVLTEKELARKYQIRYAPTLQFLSESLEKAAAANDGDAEVFRLEGYFKPYHFYFVFHYVQSKGYESQPSFQRWLGVIGKGFQARNIKYDLWVDALPPKLPDEY